MDKTVLNLELSDGAGGALTGLIVQAISGSPPKYSEELYRLYCVVTAQAQVCLDGISFELKRGQLLTLSPGEMVQFEGEIDVISCAFHHNFFCVRVMRNEVFCDGVVFNRLRGLPVVDLPDPELEIVQSRFKELAHIVQDTSLFKLEHAINTLRSLLLQAADCKIRFSSSNEILKIGSEKVSKLVSSFQDLVEDHYAEHLDVSEYSERLGVTTATLNRHVKKELGLTAKQVAQERLAIEARVALRSGERSIKDVAFDLGFEDPLYFSRFFRKQFGASPTQYFSENPA